MEAVIQETITETAVEEMELAAMATAMEIVKLVETVLEIQIRKAKQVLDIKQEL